MQRRALNLQSYLQAFLAFLYEVPGWMRIYPMVILMLLLCNFLARFGFPHPFLLQHILTAELLEIKGGARLAFNIPGQGKEVDQEARDLELEFFQQIKEELVVNPAKLFVEVDAEDMVNSSDDSDEVDFQQVSPMASLIEVSIV